MINKKLNQYFINIILSLFLVLSLNYIKNISYFKTNNLKNLFNKDWIPKESIHSKEVTENFLNSIKKYKINNISNKNYIYYRTITYSYPILFEKSSNNVIFFKEMEVELKNCEKIDETSKIILAKC